ncbi:MAG: GIY-YIG nuclease family protein [Succinivibrio sp.]|nr:GIY-YIG nuclease family protein [Succinivibrio sp.]
MLLLHFSDHEVHRVLINSRIKRKKFEEGKGVEWFEVDLQTVKDAIAAVKNGYSNLSNSTSKEHVEIVFRPEQKEALEQTKKQFRKKNNRSEI